MREQGCTCAESSERTIRFSLLSGFSFCLYFDCSLKAVVRTRQLRCVLLVGNSENHFEGNLAEECALEAAVDCLVQSNNVVAVSEVDHPVNSTTVDSQGKLDGCTGKVVIDELCRLHHRT